MKTRLVWLLLASHVTVAIPGFGAGVYVLPILTAPEAPSAEEVGANAATATYVGTFRRDLEDSDALHWGEGTVAIGPESISLMGQLAPGPDYRLYLSPEFVETERAFKDLKSNMVEVGAVRTFDNFSVPVPAGIDPSAYNSVIVWCESFGQFITAARYQ